MNPSSPTRPSATQSHSRFVYLCLVVYGLSFPSIAFPQPQDRDHNGIINIHDLILFLADFQPSQDNLNEFLSYTTGWNSNPSFTFNIKDYFVNTAGSTWHYTGMNGASTEDDFRWTVEATQQDVGGGKMASRSGLIPTNPLMTVMAMWTFGWWRAMEDCFIVDFTWANHIRLRGDW